MAQTYQARLWRGEDGSQIPLGGVVNALSDEVIRPNELADASNYIPDEVTSGVLITREGQTKYSSSLAANITSIYHGRNANYCTGDGATEVIYTLTGTSKDTGLTTPTISPDWTSFANLDIMVNGTEARKTTDGSTFASLTGCPSGAKYVAVANNFLYVAGHDRGKLRWGNVGTTTFPTSNELILTQDEGDDVVGLKKTRNALLVLCQKSFFLVTGYTNLNQGVSYYSSEAGGTSHKSISVTDSGEFWWSNHGIVWFRRDNTIDYPMVRRIPKTLAGLNAAKSSLVHSTWNPYKHCVHFWVCSGASTTINARIDYYYLNDAFYLHSGVGTQCPSSGGVVVSGAWGLYVGSYSAVGYAYSQAGDTDDGTNISAYLETRRDGDGSTLKTARVVTVTTGNGGSAAMTYGCYIDNATALAAADTYSFTPATGGVDTAIGINRTCRKIKHRVAAAAATRTKITGIVEDGTVHRSR